LKKRHKSEFEDLYETELSHDQDDEIDEEEIEEKNASDK
jgi:hypothetical protein